jgi:chromosome segregation ATPase
MAFEQISEQSSSETDEEKQKLRMFLPYASNYDMSCLNTAVKDYKRWMSKASAYLQEVEEEMEACKCSEERKKLSPSETDLERENALFAQKNASLEDKVKDKEKYIKREEEEHEEKKELLKEAREEKKVKDDKLEEINNELNKLRLKEQKLADENIRLKKQTKELQQYKLRSQEEKLQRIVLRRRGAEREEFKKLCAAYEKLEQSSKKEERDEARIEKDNLEKNIEEKLLTNEVDFEDIQTLFKMCEDIAKSQVELQAFIEVPPRN